MQIAILIFGVFGYMPNVQSRCIFLSIACIFDIAKFNDDMLKSKKRQHLENISQSKSWIIIRQYLHEQTKNCCIYITGKTDLCDTTKIMYDLYVLCDICCPQTNPVPVESKLKPMKKSDGVFQRYDDGIENIEHRFGEMTKVEEILVKCSAAECIDKSLHNRIIFPLKIFWMDQHQMTLKFMWLICFVLSKTGKFYAEKWICSKIMSLVWKCYGKYQRIYAVSSWLCIDQTWKNNLKTNHVEIIKKNESIK